MSIPVPGDTNYDYYQDALARVSSYRRLLQSAQQQYDELASQIDLLEAQVVEGQIVLDLIVNGCDGDSSSVVDSEGG